MPARAHQPGFLSRPDPLPSLVSVGFFMRKKKPGAFLPKAGLLGTPRGVRRGV